MAPNATPPPSAESDSSGEGMDTLTLGLFTQTETATYASAASETGERQETDEELWALDKKVRHEEEAYMEELRVTRGRKRDLSSAAGSDDEQGSLSKKSMASETSPDVDSATPPDNQENNEDNDESSHPEENNDSTEPAIPTQQEPATPSSAGPRHFMAALNATSWQLSALMQAIPSEHYYYCHSLFLQHKQGDINNAKARSHAKSNKEKSAWKKLKGTISQDAFAMLLTNFKELQEKYGIFTSD